MQITCDSCSARLNVPDKLKGKAVRCPKCQNPVRVPGGAPASAAGRPRSGPEARRPERRSLAEPKSRGGSSSGKYVLIGAFVAVPVIIIAVIVFSGGGSTTPDGSSQPVAGNPPGNGAEKPPKPDKDKDTEKPPPKPIVEDDSGVLTFAMQTVQDWFSERMLAGKVDELVKTAADDSVAEKFRSFFSNLCHFKLTADEFEVGDRSAKWNFPYTIEHEHTGKRLCIEGDFTTTWIVRDKTPLVSAIEITEKSSKEITFRDRLERGYASNRPDDPERVFFIYHGNVTLTGITLQVAFDTIKSESTRIRFSVDDDVNLNQIVNIQLENVKLWQILDHLREKNNLDYKLDPDGSIRISNKS